MVGTSHQLSKGGVAMQQHSATHISFLSVLRLKLRADVCSRRRLLMARLVQPMLLLLDCLERLLLLIIRSMKLMAC